MNRLLLCTDLDRTLLPNGSQPESPGARDYFRQLAEHGQLTLAYVSGRHRALVEEAIEQYRLPRPDFVIGDVGTSIYTVSGEEWRFWEAWQREIGPDWGAFDHSGLKGMFSDLRPLRLQEHEKQGIYKLSYYAPADIAIEPLLETMHQRLKDSSVRARLVWSIDETTPVGLLDVLPATASKRHAIEFLMERQGFDLKHTVFAGDSGNDLPVLTSPLHSVLVANATAKVKAEALALVRDQHTEHAFYQAQGGFLGMNGNYSAGILEGLVHYLPETAAWLKRGNEHDSK